MNENWQPIDTAPKDGTWIMVWMHIYARPEIVQWNDYAWFTTSKILGWKVKYWMPIPKGPE